jgi:hypothetical protein
MRNVRSLVGMFKVREGEPRGVGGEEEDMLKRGEVRRGEVEMRLR